MDTFRIRDSAMAVASALSCVVGLFSSASAQASSLILNHSLENPDVSVSGEPLGWSFDQWGDLSAEFSYPVPGKNGVAVETKITRHADGDAKWHSDPVQVSGGRTYRFEGAYQSSVPSELVLDFLMPDGSHYYDDPFGPLPASDDWATASGTFVPPEGAVSVTVLHVIRGVGWLRVDEAVLFEAGLTPEPVPGNLVSNPEFETVSADGASPDSWMMGNWGNNAAKFTYPVPGPGGSKAAEVSVSAWTDGDAKWYFPDIPATVGEYEYSDRYESDVPTSLEARFAMPDGTFRYAYLLGLSATQGWAESAVKIQVPEGAVSLTVFHILEGVGKLKLDSASLRATGAAQNGDHFSEGMVSLTFDDIWESDPVLPALNSAGIKGTFYLVSSDVSLDVLPYSKIPEIQLSGHEIGAHTRTHPDLTGLTREGMDSEISGSRQDMVRAGLGEVTTFAYPFGAYDDAVIQATVDAGFIGARGTEEGYNTKSAKKYGLIVQNVRNTTTLEEMKSWVDEAVATKTWLILVFHEVNGSNMPYGTTPEIFQAFVEYVRSSGVATVTVEQGMKMLPATTLP